MSETSKHLDEGTIHAWLDGALSPDESGHVESHVNVCADCAALAAEARGLIAASSRILSSLDAMPSGVIPGSSGGMDQLAALRARRAAVTRVWWRDRRFIAAASLVLVAGVSSVVWRSTQDQTGAARANATADSVGPVSTAAPSVSTAQVSPSEPAAREALPGNAKVEVGRPVRDTAPVRVAARQAADSYADVKVASASVASAREAAAVGAVAQQAIDSTKALSRADQSTFERKVQQQVQSAPTPPRIIPEQQQQAGAARPAAPAPSPAPLAARNRREVDAAAFGAGLRVSGSGPVAGGCYVLSFVAPDDSGKLVAADTILLLDMASPERSDPSWFLARRVHGSPDGDMRWRQIDSVTVELRNRTTLLPSVVRFQTKLRVVFEGGGQVVVAGLPEVTGLPDVKAMWANKVRCP